MPKFVADGNQQHLQAIKEFTDREEPRKVFWDKYHAVSQNLQTKDQQSEQKITVISYYGFGGIGKSSLLRKLQQEITDQAPKTKSILVDFDKIADLGNNTLAILRFIENELRDRYNFSFPFFDLVAFDYETKLGRNPTREELSGILQVNEDLSFALDIIGEIPLINVLPKIVNLGNKATGFAMRRSRDAKLRSHIDEIGRLTIEQLQQQLPYYFAVDLKANLLKEKAPFVFFFDTYEKLVNELISFGNQVDNDLWLRGDNGLIPQLPNVIWVIAGREKLKWIDMDSDWEGSLDQHLLGNLSFPDTQHFLEKAGLTDQDLIRQIYDLTKGTPIFLDMCVDTYTRLLEQSKTPTIADFGKNTNDLTKRFFVYMDADDYDLCTALAFLGSWTDADVAERIKAIFGNFPATRYETLKNSSFIVEENGNFKIHDVVKDVIIANTKTATHLKIAKALQAETETKIKAITPAKSTAKTPQLAPSTNHPYEQLINQLLAKLTNSPTESDFNRDVDYLVAKIEEYQDKLNRCYCLPKNSLAVFAQFKHTAGYIKLQCFDSLDAKPAYRNYTKLKEDFADQDYLLPIRQYAHWCPRRHTPGEAEYHKAIHTIVAKEGLSELYLIRVDYLLATQQQHYADFDYFADKVASTKCQQPKSLLIELLVCAANYYRIYGAIEGRHDDDGHSTYFDETFECLGHVLQRLIHELTADPKLLSTYTFHALADCIQHLKGKNAALVFNYLYSVRQSIFSTADIAFLDNFAQALRNCLGGNLGKDASIDDESLHFKAIDCLETVCERYDDLYGADSLPSVTNRNTLAIQSDLFADPDYFYNHIQAIAQKFGSLDARTTDAYAKFCHRFKIQLDQSDEDALTVKNCIAIIKNLSKLAQPYKDYETQDAAAQTTIKDILSYIDEALLDLYHWLSRESHPQLDHNSWTPLLDYLAIDQKPEYQNWYSAQLLDCLHTYIIQHYYDRDSDCYLSSTCDKALQRIRAIAHANLGIDSYAKAINAIVHKQILQNIISYTNAIDIITRRQILEKGYANDNLSADASVYKLIHTLLCIDENYDRSTTIHNGETTFRLTKSRELYQIIRNHTPTAKPNKLGKALLDASRQVEDARAQLYLAMAKSLCNEQSALADLKRIPTDYPKATKDKAFLAEFNEAKTLVKVCLNTAQNDTGA